MALMKVGQHQAHSVLLWLVGLESSTGPQGASQVNSWVDAKGKSSSAQQLPVSSGQLINRWRGGGAAATVGFGWAEKVGAILRYSHLVVIQWSDQVSYYQVTLSLVGRIPPPSPFPPPTAGHTPEAT